VAGIDPAVFKVSVEMFKPDEAASLPRDLNDSEFYAEFRQYHRPGRLNFSNQRN
jgi:hypothetical protein